MFQGRCPRKEPKLNDGVSIQAPQMLNKSIVLSYSVLYGFSFVSLELVRIHEVITSAHSAVLDLHHACLSRMK